MNSFEQIVAKIFESKNYWVKSNVRVELTDKEKIRIMMDKKKGLSLPRPEIDIVAYSPTRNELLIVETKSYFNSFGVKLSEVSRQHSVPKGTFKLITCKNYRQIVTNGLIREFVNRDLIKSKSVKVRYFLVGGNTYPQNKPESIEKIKNFLEGKKIAYWGIEDIRRELAVIADSGYEDDVVTMATKIYRDPKELLE